MGLKLKLALYSDVETLCIDNKQLSTDLSDAVKPVTGYTDDGDGYKSSRQQSVATYELSVSGGSTSDSIVSNEPSAEGDGQNSFPRDQSIIFYFTNHNKTSYENSYESDGNLPYWDPASMNDYSDSYLEDSIEETSSVYTDVNKQLIPDKDVAPVLTVEAANRSKVSEIKINLQKQGQ
eukprot:4827761-Ditylum_brightwellii.AAC.1